ncbi:hypothetical protein H0H93_001759 [Arthromyces matolae]|nr:hypothetical protein H0H93_001759 [Arthromyces matolae]
MRGLVTSTIIEAKKDNLPNALPQAGVAAASYCAQHNLSSIRGCITSGEQWMFFAYKKDGAAAKLAFSEQIDLGSSLENLALVLGLLKDLVQNALVPQQRFFSDV